MMSMTIPCIGLYILQYRCLDTWSKPTASGWPDSAAPYACLTPGTYGIPPPRQKPDARVCQQRFSELCTLVKICDLLFFFSIEFDSSHSRRIMHREFGQV